jgi:hypothetical protein
MKTFIKNTSGIIRKIAGDRPFKKENFKKNSATLLIAAKKIIIMQNLMLTKSTF